MNDTVKSENVLIIECAFVDGDTRTITLKNPRSNISASDIEDLETFMLENKIIIGDRDGSEFRKIKKAVRRQTMTRYIDLS